MATLNQMESELLIFFTKPGGVIKGWLKLMKIERLKSILLIILVISSIVLTANKWFNEELWPEGYSFFSDVKNRLSGDNNKAKAEFSPNKEVLRPAKIIVNNLSSHVQYTKSAENYDEICDEITGVLSSSLKSDKISKVENEEWDNLLKMKSCYFSYPVIYDASYFASQLSGKYTGSVKYFKEFIITEDPRISSLTHLYLKDSVTGVIEKIVVDYDSRIIKKYISYAKNETNEISYYSFELNFDTEDKSKIKDHAIIGRDVLINISEKNLPKLSEQNIFKNIADNDSLYTPILSYFQYNTSGIRKYVESDNSMVFVENYGTLKLHSNGVLEYKSNDKTKGIKLDNSSVNACLNSCMTFVNGVTMLMNKNPLLYYEISSDIHDIQSLSFNMTFDYYINDSKIIFDEKKYNTKNAISVEVENGAIISYTQVFNSYLPYQETVNCGSAINAIDNLNTDKLTSKDEKITDIFTAYHYNKQGIWTPLWYIKDSKGNTTAIKTESVVPSDLEVQ